MIQNSANRKGHEATCPIRFWVSIRKLQCEGRVGWGWWYNNKINKIKMVWDTYKRGFVATWEMQISNF